MVSAKPPQRQTCPELRLPSAGKVDFTKFSDLEFERKKLIVGWFERAWDQFQRSPEDPFEAFISLWLAFNGWASCVTDRDTDRQIIDTLAINVQVSNDFLRIMNDGNSSVRTSAESLVKFLPIFDSKTLLKKVPSMPYELIDNRKGQVNYYLQHGATAYDPACWPRHRQADGQPPIDWPHILKPIYKIRCNLFHGHKAAHYKMDQLIVGAAFLTLGTFLKDAKYLEVGNPPDWFA